MITDRERAALAALSAGLREEGFSSIRYSLSETISRKTSVRNSRPDKNSDSTDCIYTVSAVLDGREGSAGFTEIPDAALAASLLRGICAISESAQADGALFGPSETGGGPAALNTGTENGQAESNAQADGGAADANTGARGTLAESRKADGIRPEANGRAAAKGAGETKKAAPLPFFWEPHEAVASRLAKAEKQALLLPRTALVETFSYEQVSQRVYMLAEDGTDIFSDSTGYRCLRAGVMARAPKPQESVEYVFSCRCGSSLDETDPEGLVLETAREAADGLSGRPLASGSYPVILKNTVMAELLEAFLPAFFADRISGGQSCLAGKEGTSVAAPHLSIREVPDIPGGRVARAVDDEGTPVQEKYLVRSGLLYLPLYCLSSARKAGAQSTGNGFKAGPQSGIETGVTNVILESSMALSAPSLPALARYMGNGILVTAIDGTFAGTDVKTGAFSLIARGRRIENGQTAGAFREVTIAGNFFSLLKEIRLTGSDPAGLAPDSASVLAPSVLAGELVVSGT